MTNEEIKVWIDKQITISGGRVRLQYPTRPEDCRDIMLMVNPAAPEFVENLRDSLSAFVVRMIEKCGVPQEDDPCPTPTL